jgi:hypothetical protein
MLEHNKESTLVYVIKHNFLIVKINCNMDLSLCLCFVLVCHKHICTLEIL